MKGFTLSFWPGLMLALTLRLGPGVGILLYALSQGDSFKCGVTAGLGISFTLDGACKLYRELRGV